MAEIRVSFPCGDLTLEGALHLPSGKGRLPAVVLCHPHPQYGGSMDNNVVAALASALVSRGIIAFRFNFRGVDGSGGRFDGGEGEENDVSAALDFLASRKEVDARRLAVAGYSFGARVALPVAFADDRVKAVVLVSPPADCSVLRESSKPWLIIYGSRDDFVPREGLPSLVSPQVQVKMVDGADHFWLGHESKLAQEAVFFLAGYL